jgi:4-amino-4-deoxy-L-arabinose transferase-like glycosyltransferase
MNVKINTWGLPIIFVVINIFFKSLFLTSQPICIDEPFTIYHAQFDFFNLIHYLKNYNNPPLFEFILHFWIKLFGLSVTSVRVLPMLFSSLTIFFIYRMGIMFFDKRVAIVSSALFTLSTINIWFAHDCRVYSLFVLLTTISFYLFFTLLKSKGHFSWLNVLIFSFVNLSLIYGHYFGFFVLGIEFLIISLFFLRAKEVLKKYFTSILFTLICYIPQIVILWERTKSSVNNGTWVKPPEGIESLYNMLWSFCNEPVPTVICILLLFIAATSYLLKKGKQIENPYAKYIILWFIVPFLLMFFISYKVPMFLDRYLVFISPAFYILLAISLSHLIKSSKAFIIGAIFLVSLFIFSAALNPSKKRDIEGVVNYIRSKKEEKTIIIGCGYDFILNFAYYYNLDHFKVKDQNFEYTELENSLAKENIYFVNTVDANLETKINDFSKVIYLDASADFSSSNNTIKDTFFKNYKFINRTFYYELFNIYTFQVKK